MKNFVLSKSQCPGEGDTKTSNVDCVKYTNILELYSFLFSANKMLLTKTLLLEKNKIRKVFTVGETISRSTRLLQPTTNLVLK